MKVLPLELRLGKQPTLSPRTTLSISSLRQSILSFDSQGISNSAQGDTNKCQRCARSNVSTMYPALTPHRRLDLPAGSSMSPM